MGKSIAYVEYDSNNSGGRWWLKDDDWKALEAAGWEVKWCANEDRRYFNFSPDAEGRWLGALATKAIKRDTTLAEAAAEWERITGACATDAGCACCGQPHTFTAYDKDDRYIESGPHAYYGASW